MAEFTMTIDGKGIQSDKTFGVINPATEETINQCPACSEAQLDSAMEAAEKALPSWQADEGKRRQVLRDCAEAIRSRSQEIAELLTLEQGKTLHESLMEINMLAMDFQFCAAHEIPHEMILDNDQARIEVFYKPLGVIGGIAPWNAPVLLGYGKVSPALLTGNSIVLKPSSYTPLSTLKIGEILRDIVPPGVMNIVSGGSEVGEWIAEHPAVRKVSFTGSVEVGKSVAKAASSDLKRVVLELGGNDPAIVLPDIDPKIVAPKLCMAAFLFSGQVCMAIKRIYAHEDIFEPLVEELVNIAKNKKVGDGLKPGTEMGPLNNPAQLEWVTDLVEDAKEAGANILTGGYRPDGPGYFFLPSIVTDISDGTRLVDEEQFGPVIPVMKFSDIDDVISRANNSHFGLGGSVWTKDFEKGAEIASRLECGTGWVNQHMFGAAPAPFGGWKWSGIGRQLGKWGIEAYTELQTISISK